MKLAANRSPLATLTLVLIVTSCSLGSSGYGEPADGLGCDATGQEPIRARVSLHLVTGKVREPATMGVGSTGSCNYLVRTENEDGIIIVRGDAAETATLETFLTIWEYAIPAGSGGASAFREASSAGEIVVNGEPVPGGPESVRLRDGDVIELIAP